jgi:ribosomal protein L37E
MEEQEKLINSFKKAIQSAIKKTAEKNMVDLAFLGFEVKITIYNSDFSIEDEIKIIDTNHHGRCIFCGKKTYYYDENMHDYICASCFGEMKKNEEKE